MVFDEAAVPSMGESCRALEVQRNDDEEDNTPESCNPDSRNLCRATPVEKIRTDLWGSRRYGKLKLCYMSRMMMNGMITRGKLP
jgi:hypothetical protein